MEDKSGNGNDDATLQSDAAVETIKGTPKEDQPFTILKSQLLTNDSDIDSSSFDIISVQDAQHGTVALDGDGNILFTPELNYNGSASFTYTLQDNSADANSDKSVARVDFDIEAVNDAPIVLNYSDTHQEDSIVFDDEDGNTDGSVYGSVNLLDGASDVDSDTPTEIARVNGRSDLVGKVVKVPFYYTDSNGDDKQIDLNVTIENGGHYYIEQTDIANKIPKDSTAIGTIRYQVEDSSGALSISRKLQINIEGSNDNPNAVDDTDVMKSNSYVDVTPNNAHIDTGNGITFTDAFTISQKIRVDKAGIVFNKEDVFEVAVVSNGSVQYAIKADDGSGWKWNDTGYDLPLSEFHTLTSVYDGSQNSLKFYVDGLEVSSSSENVPSALYQNDDALLFGERGNNNQPMEGIFDDIQIYDKPLTDDEVSKVANGGTIDGISAYYDFEGYNPLEDKSGNGNDATLQSDATVEVEFQGEVEKISTKEGMDLTLLSSDLLRNDEDIDGDSLSISSVSATDDTHGTVTYDSNSERILYSPDDGYSGEIKFKYTIDDGQGGSDSAFVTVMVEKLGTVDDDTMLYDGSTVIDALAGDDTIELVDGLDIDFSGKTTPFKNIESIDLTKNGDHELLNISAADVRRMTDTSNLVTINSDAGDIVNLTTEWTDKGNGLYEHDDGQGNADSITKIQINGGATITTNSTVIDGTIVGLEYVTSSGLTGFTEADGSFDYVEGDIVTFKLGSMVIGSLDMDDIGDNKVFLQDIAGTSRTDMNDEYVENLAVLLQSVDSDSGDNILITEETRDAFGDVDLDLESATEDELKATLEDRGVEAISESDAMEHVGEMLEKYDGVEEGTLQEHIDDDSTTNEDESVVDIDDDSTTNEDESMVNIDDDSIDLSLVGDDEAMVGEEDSEGNEEITDEFDWLFEGDIEGSVTEIDGDGTIEERGEVKFTDSDGNEQEFVAGNGEASDDTIGTLTIDADGNWEYSVENDQISYLDEGETKDEVFKVHSSDGTEVEIVVTITGISNGSTTEDSSEDLNDILPEEESKTEENETVESSDDNSDSDTGSVDSSNESIDDGSYVDTTVNVTVEDQPVVI
ncbi:hypothetical protein MNB_SV-6-1603 [hydrothermal vent metagenome]|uniref:LamG-like jellyroll fold domain-containing protein n=1 Tax=hydrothermal vent metagenome TaxID=652676 RepID=A0A1W1C2H7_9ZZZZ